ncbi:MAG: DUF4934 domain-containing protein [Bacteroides sp.]|nr:DUF4934 domain-containing protein [Bacteroides sp.]
MKRSLFYSFIFSGSLLLSCTHPVSENDHTIYIEKAMNRKTSLKASDYFETIHYIPLETTDESVVGEVTSVLLTGDKILVTTVQQQALLFNRETGKFIRQVEHIGEDPQGYGAATPWIDDRTGTIYFPGFREELVRFDADGNFMDKIRITAEESTASNLMSYTWIEDSTLIGYYNNMIGNNDYFFTLFQPGTDHTRTTLRNDYTPSIGLDEIQSINVLKGGSITDKYGPAAMPGIIYMEMTEPDMGTVVFTGDNFLWHLDENTYFKEPYNDTIYSITTEGLTPRLIFDPGKYHWKSTERFMQEKDKAIYITKILENQPYLFFYFITGIFNDPVPYLGVYHKNNQEVKVIPTALGIEDDLYGFVPALPFASNSKGEMAGIIPTEKITEWFTENQQHKARWPELLRELTQIREEDNPVVVIYQ